MPLYDEETTPLQVMAKANLPPTAFGLSVDDNAGVRRLINQTILPDLNATAQDDADIAAGFYDFPLADADLQVINPGWTSAQRAEKAARQESKWRRYVLLEATGELLLVAKTTGSNADELRARAELWFVRAAIAKAEAIVSTQRLVAGAEDSTAGQSGAGTISTAREDYSGLLAGAVIND